MKKNVPQKVALVTGATRGIGKAIAYALAASGMHVICTGRSKPALAKLIETLHENELEATAFAADIQKEDSIIALFAHIAKYHGRLDVCINNAGVGVYGPLQTFASSDFDTVVNTNLRGTFLCCREALKIMTLAKSGYIINIASVVGIKGYPNQAAYTASKHGVMGLTKSLAVEAAPCGIRVSAILPGGVDTDMVASARPDLDRSILLKPEDIAQTVTYLLSLSDHASIDEIYIRRRSGQPF